MTPPAELVPPAANPASPVAPAEDAAQSHDPPLALLAGGTGPGDASSHVLATAFDAERVSRLGVTACVRVTDVSPAAAREWRTVLGGASRCLIWLERPGAPPQFSDPGVLSWHRGGALGPQRLLFRQPQLARVLDWLTQVHTAVTLLVNPSCI